MVGRRPIGTGASGGGEETDRDRGNRWWGGAR